MCRQVQLQEFATFTSVLSTESKEVKFVSADNYSPLYGDEVTYVIAKDYHPLIMSNKDMKVSLKRTTVIGYYH